MKNSNSSKRRLPSRKLLARLVMTFALALVAGFSIGTGKSEAATGDWENETRFGAPEYSMVAPGPSVGPTIIDYRGKQGDYLTFNILHEGKTFEEGNGWSTSLIHIDPSLYPYLDMRNSYVLGKDGQTTVFLQNDKDSIRWNIVDSFCKDEYTYYFPMNKVLGAANNTLSTATLNLKLKDGVEPQAGETYILQNRVADRKDGNVVIRVYRQGSPSYLDKATSNSTPNMNLYDSATYQSAFTYGDQPTPYTDGSYYENPTTTLGGSMINSRLVFDIDRVQRLIRVRYSFSTDTGTEPENTSYVFLMPTEFANSIVDGKGGIGYYHVGRMGDTYPSIGSTPLSKEEIITNYSGTDTRFQGMSGVRLLQSSNRSYTQIGTYGWIKPYKFTDTSRVNAASGTIEPIQNVLEFRIKNEEFDNVLRNLGNYKFQARLYSKDEKVLPRSDAYTTGGVLVPTPYVPEISDVFVGDKSIRVSAINARTDTAKRLGSFELEGYPQNEKKSSIGNIDSTDTSNHVVSYTYRDTNADIEDILKNSKKDTKLRVRYTDNEPTKTGSIITYYGPSRWVYAHVKAKVTFDYNIDGKADEAVVAPDNEKYYGE